MEKNLDTTAWIVLLLSVLYFGGHFMVAKANGWDGVLDYNMSTSGEDLAPDISIGTGTRDTITDTVVIEPGYDIPITDSEGDTIEMEIINIMPTPAVIDQIEVYNYDTGDYLDLSLDSK
tara:strand:+ start:136 stop:492 length:357 start_codon:yes stop_codon:yes gene_type:complete